MFNNGLAQPRRSLISPADRAAHYGEKDVWGIFTPLALQHKAVNLGQGFPNIPAPNFVKVGGCGVREGSADGV